LETVNATPSSSDEEEEEEYTPLTPWIQEVEHSYRNPVSHEPIFRVGDMTKFGASFELPMGIDVTAAAMAEIFLLDRLLDHRVKCTNKYAAAHLPPARRREVSRSKVLRFLATIQYMGVVKLPAKHDYFPGNRSVKRPAKHDYFPGNRSDVLPVHHVIMLKKTRFDCLWRWFHTSHSSGGAPDETTGVTEEEEEFFEEEPQETEDGIDFASDDLYYEEDEEEEAPSPTWYASIQGFIDHVNNVSQKLCKHQAGRCPLMRCYGNSKEDLRRHTG
jgi:hypothetical protein